MKRVRLIGETFAHNVAKERYGGKGRTLGGYLAKTVNGIDLPLDDPYGAWHTVSLAPFAGEDPNRWLMFTFITSDDGFDDLDHGNAVVLKEYDLPPDAESPEVTPPDYGDGAMLKKYELPPGAKMIGG
jgi:hypothetical protein